MKKKLILFAVILILQNLLFGCKAEKRLTEETAITSAQIEIIETEHATNATEVTVPPTSYVATDEDGDTPISSPKSSMPNELETVAPTSVPMVPEQVETQSTMPDTVPATSETMEMPEIEVTEEVNYAEENPWEIE